MLVQVYEDLTKSYGWPIVRFSFQFYCGECSSSDGCWAVTSRHTGSLLRNVPSPMLFQRDDARVTLPQSHGPNFLIARIRARQVVRSGSFFFHAFRRLLWLGVCFHARGRGGW